MTYLKSACYKILALLLLLISLLFGLLYTTPGLYTLITLANVVLPGRLQVDHVSGNLMHQPVFEALRYKQGNLNLHIKHTTLTWHATMRPFMLHLDAWRMDDINFAQKKLNTLQLQATLNTQTWRLLRLDAQGENHTISIQGHGQLQTPYALTLALNIAPESAAKPGIQGQITVSGDQSQYTWDGHLTGQSPITVHGVLKEAWGFNQLDTTGSLGENTLHITGHIPEELIVNASLPKPGRLHPALTSIQTTLTAKGVIHNLRTGQLTATISPGLFQPQHTPNIVFQGGQFSIDVTPDALLSQGTFTLDPDKIMDLHVRMPHFDVRSIDWHRQPVEADLNLHVKSLAFLQEFSTLITNPQGQITAKLTAKGTLAQPNLQGTIMLEQAGLAIPDVGLVLSPLNATLTSHDTHWSMTGEIQGADGKTLALKGQGDFYPQLTGTLSLNGDHFTAIKTQEYNIQVSPQLTLMIQPKALKLSGVVTVPEAHLKPISFSNTVHLTDDAVLVQDEPTSTSPILPITTDVAIKMGDGVVLDVQGLHGYLAGEILVTQTPQRAVTAVGELSIRDGKYKAYGQNLLVEQGELLFTGGNITNPDISLRAIRRFNHSSAQFSGSNQLFDFNAANLQTIDFGNQITVGISVSGHITSPKITLISVPASLSQADILSMLLLGKPANQASQSGGQLLLAAISSMNLDSGTKGLQLLTQLKQSLGVDFNVQSASLYNQKTNQTTDNTALVVGKSLTKRLYLSYNIGLFQKDSNVLTLKYLLNKFLSVQVTTSTSGDGLDLLYSAQP